MAKRFEAISAPILADQRRFERSIAEFMKPIRSAALAKSLSLPLPVLGFGGGPLVPDAPLVCTTSKANRVVECALQRLNDCRRRHADLRHRVELIVSLTTGELLQVSNIAATEDELVRVVGADLDGFRRECFIAPEMIQYEIVTMKMPPPGAKLTVVE
jgi:hypothetical protein